MKIGTPSCGVTDMLKTYMLIVVLAIWSILPQAAAGEKHAAGAEEEAVTADIFAVAAEFIANSSMPEAEKSAILESIAAQGNRTPGEWIIETNDSVYAAALRSVSPASNPGIRVRMEEAARKIAQARAIRTFYLRASPPELAHRYADEEAFGDALAELDAAGLGRGLKLEMSLSNVSEEWAFAIARANIGAMEDLIVRIGEVERDFVDGAYCAKIAPRARERFSRGQYAEALPDYREMRDLNGGTVSDRLDLAHCYLAAGNTENAARTAAEAADEFAPSMDSETAERAADILLESKDEEYAEALYRLASEKLHSEQTMTIRFVEALR